MGSPTLPAPRPARRCNDLPFLFVSVADLRHATAPDAVIATVGLGSCLGITAYEPTVRAGSMLHAMLPDSRRHQVVRPTPAMYLDLGVPVMMEAMVRMGADLRRIELKVFGGAQILQSSEYFSIGRQNVEMMRELAARYRLRVVHWEVGGQCNRSIELHLHDGRVLLRMPGKPNTWA